MLCCIAFISSIPPIDPWFIHDVVQIMSVDCIVYIIVLISMVL